VRPDVARKVANAAPSPAHKSRSQLAAANSKPVFPAARFALFSIGVHSAQRTAAQPENDHKMQTHI